MSQGSINQAPQGRSPIEGIMQALQAVKSYYGIDTEKAQQHLLDLKAKQEESGLKTQQEASDPNSAASQYAQGQQKVALDLAKKEGLSVPSSLYDAITGKQAVSGQPAFTGNDYQRAQSQGQSGIPYSPEAPAKNFPAVEAQDAVPGLSAAQIGEKPSPLQQLLQHKMTENAANTRAAMMASQFNATQGRKDEQNIAKAYKDTMADKVVSQAKGQLAQADELLATTNDATTNPQSANALAAVAARYVSGGQRINRQEMEALGGGSKAIGDRLGQIMQTGSKGTLTPENADFMRRFISVTRQSAADTFGKAVKERADSYAKIYNVDPQALYAKFGVDPTQSSGGSQAPVQSAQNSGSFPTATGPNGQKMIFKDGQWQPM